LGVFQVAIDERDQARAGRFDVAVRDEMRLDRTV